MGGAGGFGVDEVCGGGLVGLGSDGLVAFGVKVKVGRVEKRVGVAVLVPLAVGVGLGDDVPVAVPVAVSVSV